MELGHCESDYPVLLSSGPEPINCVTLLSHQHCFATARLSTRQFVIGPQVEPLNKCVIDSPSVIPGEGRFVRSLHLVHQVEFLNTESLELIYSGLPNSTMDDVIGMNVKFLALQFVSPPTFKGRIHFPQLQRLLLWNSGPIPRRIASYSSNPQQSALHSRNFNKWFGDVPSVSIYGFIGVFKQWVPTRALT